LEVISWCIKKYIKQIVVEKLQMLDEHNSALQKLSFFVWKKIYWVDDSLLLKNKDILL